MPTKAQVLNFPTSASSQPDITPVARSLPDPAGDHVDYLARLILLIQHCDFFLREKYTMAQLVAACQVVVAYHLAGELDA